MLRFEPFNWLCLTSCLDSRWIFKGVYGLPAPWRVNKRPMPLPFEVWSFFFSIRHGWHHKTWSIHIHSRLVKRLGGGCGHSPVSGITWHRKFSATDPAADATISSKSFSDGGHTKPEVLRVTYAFLRHCSDLAGFFVWRFLSQKSQEWENHNFLEPFLAWQLLEEDTYSYRLLEQQGGNLLWHFSWFPHGTATPFRFFARNHSRIRLAMGTFLHMVCNPWYRGGCFDLGIMAPHDPGIFGPHLHQFRCESQGADHPEPIWFTQGIRWDADFVGSKLDGKVMVFVRACCLSEKQRKDKSKAGYQTNRYWSGINRLFLYLCCDVCSNGRGAHWQCGTLGNPHVSHISICRCSVIPSLQHDACLFSITGCHGKAVIVRFLCHNQKRMLWHGTCFFIRATYDLWQRSGSRMYSHMVWYGGNFWRYFALGGSDDSKGWPMWQGIHPRVDYGSHGPSVLGWPWLCCIICQDPPMGDYMFSSL